jgi:hypothetical protein
MGIEVAQGKFPFGCKQSPYAVSLLWLLEGAIFPVSIIVFKKY